MTQVEHDPLLLEVLRERESKAKLADEERIWLDKVKAKDAQLARKNALLEAKAADVERTQLEPNP